MALTLPERNPDLLIGEALTNIHSYCSVSKSKVKTTVDAVLEHLAFF